MGAVRQDWQNSSLHLPACGTVPVLCSDPKAEQGAKILSHLNC